MSRGREDANARAHRPPPKRRPSSLGTEGRHYDPRGGRKANTRGNVIRRAQICVELEARGARRARQRDGDERTLVESLASDRAIATKRVHEG